MRLPAARSLFALALIVIGGAPLSAQELRIDNTSKYQADGRYQWNVFVVADPAVLRQIQYVEYTLHPTFPDPVRRVTNPAGGFALAADGWGEFSIGVKVGFRNGQTRTLRYWLRLRESSAAQITRMDHAAQHGAIRTRNTAKPAANGRWEWEVFIEADARTLGEVKCVTYTLHPSVAQPVQTICARGTDAGRGFLLKSSGFGTFVIGVEVAFKDGDVRRLSHELAFDTSRKQAG